MKKLLYTFLAYLPIAMLILFLVALVRSESLPFGEQKDMLVERAVIYMLLSLLMTFVSMIIFVMTVCKKTAFDSGKKVFWGAMFVFYNMFAYPVYLHKYIMRGDQVSDDRKI